ncbi:uncharacterized protein LOC112586910 isoform X1 [Bubalus bubalis]|uniref:uncharacterized protein LOC112586910 isoform X1 n=1 Tax=Bubalus bubalis TaxID=89462 RepID=UPI001E1B78D4|nr:uncharacterized protein LOC112586910 isoform X1 [Bubalus bubalis]
METRDSGLGCIPKEPEASSSLLFGATYVCRAPAYLDRVDMLSGAPTPGSPRVPQQRALRLKQGDACTCSPLFLRMGKLRRTGKKAVTHTSGTCKNFFLKKVLFVLFSTISLWAGRLGFGSVMDEI